MVYAAWLAIASIAFANQLEVVATDGDPYQAELRKLAGGVATFAVEGQRNEVAVGDLRSLRNLSAADPGREAELEVSLQDGSKVRATELTSDGESLDVELAGGEVLTLEPAQVRHVRLQSLNEQQQRQWRAIVQSRIMADMLVLIRSSDSLDKIEGLVDRISPEHVQFDFEGQSIPAPRERLAGIRLYSPAEPELEKLQAIVQDIHGGEWMVSVLESASGDTLQLRLRSGIEMDLPLDQVASMDFSVGSMRYLTELEPIERSWVPRFALGVDVAGSGQLFGGHPGAVGEVAEAAGALTFFGGGSLTYRIPEDFVRIRGEVRMAIEGDTLTPCRVVVEMEKQRLFETTLRDTRQVESLDVAIVPGERLTLRVEPLADAPVGDAVKLAELRITK
jgi:hypothetical protein